MTLKQYAETYKIKPAILEGLASHLRLELDTQISEEEFSKGYYEFTGKKIITKPSEQTTNQTTQEKKEKK